jgi:hypothetical protein
MQLQIATTLVDPAPLLREAKSRLESARSGADRAHLYCAGMASGMPNAISAASSAISDVAEAIRLLHEAGASTSSAEQGVNALRDGISKATDFLAHPEQSSKALEAQNEFQTAANHLASAASSI